MGFGVSLASPESTFAGAGNPASSFVCLLAFGNQVPHQICLLQFVFAWLLDSQHHEARTGGLPKEDPAKKMMDVCALHVFVCF